jgi:dihydroxy-acid dehydratase
MLYAVGLKEEDMTKAQIGISSVWYSGNPCNMHLMGLNNIVKEGVVKAGQYCKYNWRAVQMLT